MDENASKIKIPDILRVNINTLRLCGLWNYFGPGQKSNSMYSLFTLSISIAMTLFLSSLSLEIIFNWGDLQIFSLNMSIILIYGACLYKRIGHISASKRIHRLVHKLRDGKLSPPGIWSKDQFTIARNYDRYARIMSWTYYSIGIGTLTSKVAISLAKTTISEENGNSTDISPKMLPYSGYFPYDYQEWGYYGLSFLLHIYMATVGAIQNIGWDALYIGIIIHSCGQFKILKNSLQKIKRRAIQMLQEESLPNVCSGWATEPKSCNKINTSGTDNLVRNKRANKEVFGGLQRYFDEGNEYEYCCEDHLRLKLSTCLKDCIKHHQELLK